MAVRNVKARVAIDGEKEYKQALSDLNKGNQVLASEMRKLQAQFKGNEDSTEALTAKGELLERQLLQQKDKVNTLREALQRAANEYGEADQRTQEWTIKLNNAEATQIELERSIQENNEALQHQGQEMVGLGDGVDDLAGKLGIHLPEAAKNALNGMGEFSAGTVAKMGIAAAAVAAVFEAVKKLQEITLESAAKVDDVLTESAVTGLSSKTIQELKYAEELLDVSYGTISGSLTKLTNNMADARDGNDKLGAAFQRLGVQITDSSGRLRDTEDVFYEVIDHLAAIEGQTERDALAMDLLGKSAQELNPLFEVGSHGIKEYADQAEELGYVLTEDELNALADVDDAFQRMNKTVETAKDELALDFAPASKGAMELFGKAVQTGSDILDKSGLVENLGTMLGSLADIGGSVLDLIANLPGLDMALGALKVTLGAVAQLVAVVADATDVIAGLFTLDFNRVGNALGFGYNSGNLNNWTRTRMSQDGTLAAYEAMWSKSNLGTSVYDASTGRYFGNAGGNWENVYRERDPNADLPAASYYFSDLSVLDEYNRLKGGHNAGGNANWRGGLTYLGEGGPETAILPQGTRILNAQDTAALGGDTFNFTVSVKDLEDLDQLIRWAKGARVRERMK